MENHNLPLQETLLPDFLQCFGIMFLGFTLGRLNVLGPKEANGISVFVQYLSLPALIFARISTISFEDVKWEFIASVFVTKVCIFVCVFLMTTVLSHPPDLSISCIYAIAATQSNDFALAYPLFLSLYKNAHIEYPSYLYIISPIQLLILNTIAFFIIEMQKQNSHNNRSNCYFINVLKETLKNPIVFMTIIGMIWNITIGHQILPIFNTGLKTLSSAFPATSLLLVGYTMSVRDGYKSENHKPITVALLIITKNLIFPILLQKFCTLLLKNNNAKEAQSFGSFGFLYGTTPTAPSVYVFAVQHSISVDVITKMIIGSTLLSAPLMFASASVISLSEKGTENTMFYLSLTISYLSSVSLLCCGWLLFSLIIGKRFLNIRFGITIYIIFAQFLTAFGGVLLFFQVPENSNIFYAQYVLSTSGIYATRIYTLFLGILFLVIRWRSLCFILRARRHINIISILCLILPFGIVIFTLFSKNTKQDGPNCQLGYIQHIVTFCVTLVCLITTVTCLVLQHICFRKNKKDRDLNEEHGDKVLSVDKSLNNASYENISVDVEDLANCLITNFENRLCDTQYQCSTEKKLECESKLASYNNMQEKYGLYDDREIFQHTTIVIALCVAMMLSLAVCFWKLIMEEISGIFIELEFLDVIINYSLGIFFFIILGFNEGLIKTISNTWKNLQCFNTSTKSS